MSLNYLRDICHKHAVTHSRESRWFESMYTMLYMLSPHMVQDHTYLTWSTYSDLSHSHQQSWAGSLLPRKRVFDTIHITLVDRSAGPYPVSLLSQPMKQWGQSQASVDGSYSAYWSHKHQHAIGTFNTCSWGSTHQSLTDAGGGYSLEDADLPHTTPRPSWLTVSLST
jgi:hypothetical protein